VIVPARPIIKCAPDEYRVMGVDPNSYMGVVVLQGGKLVDSKQVNFPEDKGFTRLQYFGQSIRALLDQWSPDAVFIEGYAFANRFTLVKVVEFGTVIRTALHEGKHSWWSVQPSALKKFTTGKGNAKKPEMKAAVEAKWNFKSTSDDVVDAYALARFGWEVATSASPKLLFTPGD
jgi:crossover junction endodeoxyribonuclease RuvC